MSNLRLNSPVSLINRRRLVITSWERKLLINIERQLIKISIILIIIRKLTLLHCLPDASLSMISSRTWFLFNVQIREVCRLNLLNTPKGAIYFHPWLKEMIIWMIHKNFNKFLQILSWSCLKGRRTYNLKKLIYLLLALLMEEKHIVLKWKVNYSMLMHSKKIQFKPPNKWRRRLTHQWEKITFKKSINKPWKKIWTNLWMILDNLKKISIKPLQNIHQQNVLMYSNKILQIKSVGKENICLKHPTKDQSIQELSSNP